MFGNLMLITTLLSLLSSVSGPGPSYNPAVTLFAVYATHSQNKKSSLATVLLIPVTALFDLIYLVAFHKNFPNEAITVFTSLVFVAKVISLFLIPGFLNENGLGIRDISSLFQKGQIDSAEKPKPYEIGSVDPAVHTGDVAIDTNAFSYQSA